VPPDGGRGGERPRGPPRRRRRWSWEAERGHVSRRDTTPMREIREGKRRRLF
jgi:hypothetical protein